MKLFGSKIIQVFMDIVVGLAVYFSLNAFVKGISVNRAVVITLIISMLFSEFVEIHFKK